MTLKITVIQADLIWEKPEANLQKFEEKIEHLDENTDLIILPEMFAYGYSMKPQKFASYQDKIMQTVAEAAALKQAVICTGVITERKGDYYNTLVWMHPDGSCQMYDKRHLFSFAGEQFYYKPGTEQIICKVKGWRVKPLICYDLRFPVWSRNRNDYDLLVYIANWPESRQNAWSTLLKARAIENQVYVAGVNRVGKDGNGVYHSGDSVVVDPKGHVISDIKPHKEAVQTLSLDLDALNAFRKKFPVGQDADKFSILS